MVGDLEVKMAYSVYKDLDKIFNELFPLEKDKPHLAFERLYHFIATFEDLLPEEFEAVQENTFYKNRRRR